MQDVDSPSGAYARTIRIDEPDSINDMLVFASTVAGGSLSAGGRTLGLSPAVVSKRLLKLEARLGVRLLNRTSRHMSLTEEGRVYHDWSRRILADIEEAESAVSAGRLAPRGRLTVTASVAFGRKHVAPLAAAFIDRHPDVSIDLQLTDSILNLLDDGIDLAIRMGRPTDPGLITRRLATNRRVVCASPDYLNERSGPQSPDELVQHNCLVLERPGARQDLWQFETPGGEHCGVRVTGTLRSNNGEVLHDWALAGRGVIWKSTWDVHDDLRSGRLVSVLSDYACFGADIHAVFPDRRLLSAKVRAFIDFAAEAFGSEPYWDRDLPCLLPLDRETLDRARPTAA